MVVRSQVKENDLMAAVFSEGFLLPTQLGYSVPVTTWILFKVINVQYFKISTNGLLS